MYPSYAAWDKSNAINANSEELAIFAAETRESVSFVGSSIFEFTGVVVGNGEVETGSAMTMVYQLSVSDPETYATALKRFDEAAPSENLSGLFQIRGAGESDITHVLSISANSIADLMGNLKKDQKGSAFESFIDDISSTRSVVDHLSVRASLYLETDFLPKLSGLQWPLEFNNAKSSSVQTTMR